MMKRLCLLMTLLLAQYPCAAAAQPMVFSRETLDILTMRRSSPVPEEAKEKQEKKKEKDKKEAVKPPEPEWVTKRHSFVVEIYPLRATQFDWFLSREQLAPGRGILVVLENKDEMVLSSSNVTTSYDILFIQSSGEIQAIAPDVTLADLTESLEITGKIRAVLYLKSGTAAAADIKPGDQVEHAMFSPAPKLLQ